MISSNDVMVLAQSIQDGVQHQVDQMTDDLGEDVEQDAESLDRPYVDLEDQDGIRVVVQTAAVVATVRVDALEQDWTLQVDFQGRNEKPRQGRKLLARFVFAGQTHLASSQQNIYLEGKSAQQYSDAAVAVRRSLARHQVGTSEFVQDLCGWIMDCLDY